METENVKAIPNYALNSSSYIYNPIQGQDCIRLLKLLPGEFGSHIRCELSDEVSLDTKPDYEALSYTWGDEQTPEIIYLHGNTHAITQNLAFALRYLRNPDQERILWVDALCINQQDVKERNHQVSFMRKIYLSCRQVAAFLGTTSRLNEAVRFMAEMATLDASNERSSIFEWPDSSWEACEDIFSRTWWSRIWILQEVIHNNPVLIYDGDQTPISIDNLMEHYDRYHSYVHIRNSVGKLDTIFSSVAGMSLTVGGIVQSAPKCIIDLRKAAVLSSDTTATHPPGEHWPPSLAFLLLDFHAQKSKDPRDKIYALLGIAEFDHIPIDYSCGTTKDSLYTHLSRITLPESLLSLLAVESLDRPIESLDSLPSWVPDYTTDMSLLVRRKFIAADLFYADCDFPTSNISQNCYCKIKLPFLELKGILIGVVTRIKKTRITNNEKLEGEDDAVLFQYKDCSKAQRGDWEKYYLWHMLQDFVTLTPENTSWGPVHMCIGDVIIVAAGLGVPIILRCLGDEYLFVGTCWLIDGRIEPLKALVRQSDQGLSDIMFGKACKDVQCGDRVVETFRIR